MTCKRMGLLALALVAVISVRAQSPGGTSVTKVPSGVILVKGAWSSASDQTTPVPEGGQVTNIAYDNRYFQLSLPLPQGWVKKYDGPPPSDTGYYVLAQLEPHDMVNGTIRGSMMITAADLFFSPTRANDALQFVRFARNNLQTDYTVARDPTPVALGGHSFVRFDYFSRVAGLHWDVLATQVRCHIVQFVFTSRDTKLLESLVEDLSKAKLTEDGSAPVCIKDYAIPENIVEKVDPIFAERRFNPIPVRVIIDKEGKVAHIHFLSAFPEQAKAITDALQQWRFKPYLRDGQPVQVETGILFGRTPAEAPDQQRRTTTATR
jgi:Gram-negative bacterial TonB protein C-terminal